MTITPISLIVMILGGYLIGTFPSAYVLRRITSGADIRREGSGNVGARNLYEVTGVKWLGIAAMFIDALKGVVTVLIAMLLFGDAFAPKAFMSVAAVVGHNYNIFLRGHGGRGLATALGVGIMINPFMIFTWGLMYLVGYYVFKRDVAVGSMTGTIAVAVLAYSLPDLVIDVTTIVPYQALSDVRLFIAVIMVPIFMRFLAPVREIMRTAATEEESENDDQ